MHDHTAGRRSRRALVLVALGGLLASSATTLATTTLATATTAAATSQAASKLSKHDHELLAAARGDGSSAVTMLIAAQPGQGSTVASGLASLGATVGYRDDDVGYLRARVPVGTADAVSKLAGVQAAGVDETVAVSGSTARLAAGSAAVAAPGAATPAQNPYLPTQDIGAPQFVASHPTYDGRGVRIGILDTGVDLLTPELRTAKDLAGNTVPKVADWITYTDPVDDNDPTWLDMSRQVTPSGGTFAVDGTTYVAPASGTYRFAVLNERDPRLGGELGNDLNRDGNPAGSSGLFAVLWSTASNSVWVDTDQDGSFADQAAMTDYAVHHDMGTFGTDRPATAERDSVPFVVQTDGKDKYVNIGIVSGGHGTHVAGIAAGKDFFGGTFDGAAPEAQIVSIRVCLFISGCTSHALVEGMIFAVKQEHVDVVNLSVGTQFLNDGGSPRAVVYDRLIKQYKAQLVVSAANEGPGVNTVSLASDVIGVGAYVSKATWLADFGVETATADGLLPSSARGPREDGALKPDVVAPGAALSATPAWQPGSPASGAYGLPPGYSVRSGTSMAAPEVTGGAALLISAAKQAGAQYAPDQLRQAISSSARFLPAHGANEQGNGLLQVGAAWNLLRTNAVKTVGITSTAPVRTVASGLLGTPHTGPGIYEREGWTAGQSGARTITFTRTTGGSKAIAYDLSWVGNDGTFSTSAGSISLPVDAPVSLVVHVAPATVGVHSALLRLDDPSTAGIDYETLDTVVAANRLTAANGYAVTQTGSTERGGTASFFFDVPAGTPALKVDLSGTGGQLRMLRFPPYGYSDDSATAPYQAGSQSRTVSDPQAGVWEVTVDTSTGSATAPGTFAVTGSLLGVDIAPAAWVIDGAQTGTAHDRSFAMTNRFGAFTGAEVGTALGSTFADRPAVAAGAGLQLYPIDVPAASTSISARIGNASDPAADLDLYLADCHTGSCVPRAISAGGTANEAVSVSDPAPGRWIVFVDPFAVPSGSTRYDYLDVVASPAFGSVSVDGVPAARAAGATWTVGASVTPLAAPAPGRFLQGFVQVSGGGGILGSAEVDLRSVVP